MISKCVSIMASQQFFITINHTQSHMEPSITFPHEFSEQCGPPQHSYRQGGRFYPYTVRKAFTHVEVACKMLPLLAGGAYGYKFRCGVILIDFRPVILLDRPRSGESFLTVILGQKKKRVNLNLH